MQRRQKGQRRGNSSSAFGFPEERNFGMMKLIRAVADIDYSTNSEVSFEATVSCIQSEGNEERRAPLKILAKLESSGENVLCISWDYSLLPNLRILANGLQVAIFVGQTDISKQGQQQIRISTITMTGKDSVMKVMRTAENVGVIKTEISDLERKYVRTPQIKKLLDDLVVNNENFFIWPAAKTLHHNYTGGLAKHSLSVANLAAGMWANSQGENLDIEILIAGALLHDIGKLKEYNSDGSITAGGELLGHIVFGENMICSWARDNGIDPDKDVRIMMLRHIIVSHHGSLDKGSPVAPAILEAEIVSMADAADADIEGINKELGNINRGEKTSALLICDNRRMLKWK